LKNTVLGHSFYNWPTSLRSTIRRTDGFSLARPYSRKPHLGLPEKNSTDADFHSTLYSTDIVMWPADVNVSESIVSECQRCASRGIFFWTAGQRIDPNQYTNFVWRVTPANTDSGEKVSEMSYSHFAGGQPDYFHGSEACVHLLSANSYRWNDAYCRNEMCSVCEIDL